MRSIVVLPVFGSFFDAGEHHLAVSERTVEAERPAAIVDPGLVPALAPRIVEVQALAGHPARALPVLQQRAAFEDLLDAIHAGGLAGDGDVPIADPEIELPPDLGGTPGRRWRLRLGQ